MRVQPCVPAPRPHPEHVGAGHSGGLKENLYLL